jgi:predicted AlkP superfamily phosphohydrolase/phosphomutase
MFRKRLLAHLEAGFWSGLLAGLLMAGLASYWWTPISFLFYVTNEVLFTFSFNHLPHGLAAAFSTPFAFFSLHLAGGILGGLAAGSVLGALFSWLRFDRLGRVSWYTTFVLTPATFLYALLWLLHGKLSGPRFVTGVLASIVVAVVVGILGGLLVHLLSAILSRTKRGGSLAKILKYGGAAGIATVGLAFLIGASRQFGRGPDHSGTNPSQADRYKVMIVGLDGASWTFLRPLMAEGSMPNLARLVEEGTIGPLRTSLPPIESPTVWTSVATGKRPEKHGIRGFVMLPAGEDRLVPVSSDLRRSTAFWEILSQRGRRVDVVCWYVSWPAEPVNGVFVSERLLFPDLDGVVAPAAWKDVLEMHDAEYLKHRAERLARFTSHPYDPDYSRLNHNTRDYLWGEHLSILDYSYRKDSVAFATATDLLKRGQPDVFAVYFEGIDRVSHRFLIHEMARRHPKLISTLYPQLGEEDLRLFGNVFKEYHIQIDRWLGGLLELLEEGTAVIVLSDHGFGLHKMWKVHLQMDPLLEFLGYLELEPDSHRIEWQRTTLYDAHHKSRRLGRIAVNLAGREDEGVVDASELDEVIDRARSTLESLETRDGRSVFSSVERMSEAGRSESAGELVVRLNEACLEDTLETEGRELPVSAFTRVEWMPGNHRIDGIFIGRGGPFKENAEVHAAGILDVIPTVLKLAGVPYALDMDGRPLDRAMKPSLRDRLVQTAVPTYEKKEGETPLPVTESDQPDSVIVEQLKALGYID